jgi:putative peptidoglycan lipid II flippase
MVINASLALGLSPIIGWTAPAIAATVAAWAMVVLLLIGTRHMGDVARFDAQLRKRFWRISAAAVVMGGVLMVTNVALASALGMAGVRYIALIGLISVGFITYCASGHLMGAFQISEFKKAVKRR